MYQVTNSIGGRIRLSEIKMASIESFCVVTIMVRDATPYDQQQVPLVHGVHMSDYWIVRSVSKWSGQIW